MANKLLIPDGALGTHLTGLVNANFGLAGSEMRLFTNFHVPAAGDTFATYTEPVFTGYAAQSVPGGAGWSTPTVTAHVATIESVSNITFTCTAAPGSPVICYGYFISWGTDLSFAQLFDAPIVFTNTGDSYAFPAKFTYQNAP